MWPPMRKVHFEKRPDYHQNIFQIVPDASPETYTPRATAIPHPILTAITLYRKFDEFKTN